MTSQIRVDSIVPTTGVPTGGGGGTVQCVQDVLTSTVTVTSTSFTDVGLSATITPRSNSNKILAIADISSSGTVTTRNEVLTRDRNYIFKAIGLGEDVIYGSIDVAVPRATKIDYFV